MSRDLKDKTLGELEQIVESLGGRKYMAGYIFHFIHTKDAKEISQITPLSKAFREQLAGQGYFISRLSILTKLTDKDATAKYAFALGDGCRIETVLLLDGTRKTLCVSTQVGCAMGCSFCATGKLRFRRDLTAGEIADQVNAVQKDAGRISNVVYMGMGEPLANYAEVVKSLAILNHPKGKNIGIRHITVSTCGLAPEIRKLASEDVHPRLAVSLNAPIDDLRTKLMPINAKYPMAELLKAVRFYQDKTRQRVTFEYVLIQGLNDSAGHAKMLVKLLKGLACNVNLIEHNPYPTCKYAGSGSARIREFAAVLDEAGIETTTRFRMGRNIKAACGQLGADWLGGKMK
ncbi:MAG: 23S rRNA (adenine(2503)-C(2))-methyltransferase [Planctomycetes bacterium RBG_19FT_COMBO_48_8]|nr:MAG: 23S rRNA (adenine(2503)-C(2))-methyltransferase [Planctomycetes bacterium RBG_19FT_COMBO_48_8]